MIPFITSRTSTWRLLPPRLAGGINGSTCAHSSSVRSLGYRSTLRSYRLRFFAVHIGDPSSNQATTLESQMIHWIQFVFGRTLSAIILSAHRQHLGVEGLHFHVLLIEHGHEVCYCIVSHF